MCIFSENTFLVNENTPNCSHHTFKDIDFIPSDTLFIK